MLDKGPFAEIILSFLKCPLLGLPRCSLARASSTSVKNWAGQQDKPRLWSDKNLLNRVQGNDGIWSSVFYMPFDTIYASAANVLSLWFDVVSRACAGLCRVCLRCWDTRRASWPWGGGAIACVWRAPFAFFRAPWQDRGFALRQKHLFLWQRFALGSRS